MVRDDSDLWTRSVARSAGRSAYDVAVDVLLTGIVVILPLVVTLYVLSAVFGLIVRILDPFVELLEWAGLITGIRQSAVMQFLLTTEIVTNVGDFLTHIIAVLVLGVVVVVVGAVARFQHGERVIDYFDAAVGRLPAVGAVYKSFRRMGDVMLESGVDNFRSVKLVEFPRDEVYVLGFETTTSPLAVQGAAGEDGMVTLFLPLAPNPVMGGFLAHFPDDRVADVDMTVEEAVRTIITSGIAADDPEADEYRELSDEEVRELSDPSSYEADRDGDREE